MQSEPPFMLMRKYFSTTDLNRAWAGSPLARYCSVGGFLLKTIMGSLGREYVLDALYPGEIKIS